MKKALILVAALAALLATSTSPARAIDQTDECPADYQLVVTREPNLADRDGDRTVCTLRLSLDGGTVQLWTDDTIGDPSIVPPSPCTGAYLPLEIGDPNVVGDPHIIGNPHLIGDPHIKVIDANGDGTVCAAASDTREVLILYVVDNPNALTRAEA
jgi:hypothetical protein